MPPVKKSKPLQVKSSKASLDSKKVVSGQLTKKLNKEKPKPKERPERGVVFIKHLPHGFFEEQIRQYFKQFGNVTRIRLARSERTGGSKGFAFVEFEYPEVAKVAANTMDNYLMFQKVIKASYIPPEQQKFNYFKSSVKKVKNKAGKEIYVSGVTKAVQTSVKNQNNWTESACQKRTVSGIKKLKKMQQKYAHLGIDFSNVLVEPVKKSGAVATKGVSVKTAKTKGAEKSKKKQKDLKLEDLLGNTINEDSDDEDYVDENDQMLDKEDIYDEETEEEEIDEEEDDDDDEEEEAEEEEDEGQDELEDPQPLRTGKKSQRRNTGAERLSNLINRKPGTGGVHKKKATLAAKPKSKGAKNLLQLAAAKQIAKPLQKSKLGKKLKK